jgi:hypothetical protein
MSAASSLSMLSFASHKAVLAARRR